LLVNIGVAIHDIGFAKIFILLCGLNCMAQKRYNRQPRYERSNLTAQTNRLMKGTVDLTLAGGTLMVGASALGLVKGALK